jgi:Mimiviridae cathepsin B cystein protease
MGDVNRVVIHGISRTLDWKKDRLDYRDYKFDQVGYKAIREPDVVNLTKYESPIKDQGSLGVCTGMGISGLLEFKYWNLPIPKKLIFSAQFIYYNERKMEGTISSDDGAMIRTGIKVAAQYGCSQEKLWPYSDTLEAMIKEPSREAYLDAQNYQIMSYARITNLASMTNCLAQNRPFTCGITLYESFDSDAVAKTGMVPMPGTREQPLGGHCVDCVGYSKPHKLFIMRNSWGREWASSGHFFLPLDYLANSGLASDMWTIKA